MCWKPPGFYPVKAQERADKKNIIQMNTIIKFGLAALTAGAFSTLPSGGQAGYLHATRTPHSWSLLQEQRKPATGDGCGRRTEADNIEAWEKAYETCSAGK